MPTTTPGRQPATKHTKTVDWARAHLGEAEKPPASNTGPFVQSCQKATWLKGTGWPWCVAFVVKAWTVAGFKLPYLGAGAYEMLRWYRDNAPAWVTTIANAKPGACVIFNVGTGHAALLALPYADTKPYVTTIGGNEHDAVREVTTRHVDLVRGVVDPPEATPPKPPPIAKPPAYEVVTSVDGEQQTIYVSGLKAITRRLGRFLERRGTITIRPRGEAS